MRQIHTLYKIIGLSLRQIEHNEKVRVWFGNKSTIHRLITNHHTGNDNI